MGLPFSARKWTSLPSCAGAATSGTSAPTANSVLVPEAACAGRAAAFGTDTAADGGIAACEELAAGDFRSQPSTRSETDKQLSTEIRSARDFGLNTQPN